MGSVSFSIIGKKYEFTSYFHVTKLLADERTPNDKVRNQIKYIQHNFFMQRPILSLLALLSSLSICAQSPTDLLFKFFNTSPSHLEVVYINNMLSNQDYTKDSIRQDAINKLHLYYIDHKSEIDKEIKANELKLFRDAINMIKASNPFGGLGMIASAIPDNVQSGIEEGQQQKLINEPRNEVHSIINQQDTQLEYSSTQTQRTYQPLSAQSSITQDYRDQQARQAEINKLEQLASGTSDIAKARTYRLEAQRLREGGLITTQVQQEISQRSSFSMPQSAQPQQVRGVLINGNKQNTVFLRVIYSNHGAYVESIRTSQGQIAQMDSWMRIGEYAHSTKTGPIATQIPSHMARNYEYVVNISLQEGTRMVQSVVYF